MMEKITVKVRRREGCEDLPLPCYMSEGASGLDLYADVDADLSLEPGQIKMVSTGIHIALPEGFEAQIRPRSGLAIKHGIGIVNSPGTIDADYRGLINIILINFSDAPYVIKRGSRIAQMVINRIYHAQWQQVDELESTVRDTGGFGHTGV